MSIFLPIKVIENITTIEKINPDFCNFFRIFSFSGFVAMLIMWAIYFALVLTSERVRKTNSVWCMYVFEIYFLSDIATGFLEHYFFSVYFTSYMSAYIFAFLKFVALTGLYAIISIEKRNFEKADVCKKIAENSSFSSPSIIIPGDYSNLKREQNFENSRVISNASCIQPSDKSQGVDEEVFDVKHEDKSISVDILKKLFYMDNNSTLCDVNIAYVQCVLDVLSGKNLTSDERKFVEDLKFTLKSPPAKGTDEAVKLNDDFYILIKKMSEYDVIV